MVYRPQGMGLGLKMQPPKTGKPGVLAPLDWKTATCECGAPKHPRARQCNACYLAPARARQERVLALWNAGASMEVMMEELNMTQEMVEEAVKKLRNRGVPVPYRKPRWR